MARILLAEDDVAVCDFVRRALEMDGHDVIPVHDGGEALERLVSPLEEFDLLLSDIRMPVMDGIEAIEHIMAYCPLPVIVISSMVDSEFTTNAARALGAGAVDVFSKPTPNSLEDFEDIAEELREKIKLRSEEHTSELQSH